MNGNYSEWSEWTPCTVTCGGGENMRSRTCTNPAPAFGGKDCNALGPSIETGRCKVDACPGKVLRFVIARQFSQIETPSSHMYANKRCEAPWPFCGISMKIFPGPPPCWHSAIASHMLLTRKMPLMRKTALLPCTSKALSQGRRKGTFWPEVAPSRAILTHVTSRRDLASRCVF